MFVCVYVHVYTCSLASTAGLRSTYRINHPFGVGSTSHIPTQKRERERVREDREREEKYYLIILVIVRELRCSFN